MDASIIRLDARWKNRCHFILSWVNFCRFLLPYFELELSSRTLVDRGISRKKAVLLAGTFTYLLGIPSAMSLNILSNQDFVWGLGLILSGVFIAYFAVSHGLEKLKTKPDSEPKDWKAGLWWHILIRWFVPFAGLILLAWWGWLSFTEFTPDQWYNPLAGFSPMTVIIQWGAILAILVIFNKRFSHIAD